MIEWVYRQTLGSGASEVIVATDDERIAAACRGFGAPVELTSAEHPSGTDRIAELARRFGWDDDQIVVNVQGDEPLISPVVDRADRAPARMASGCDDRDARGAARSRRRVPRPELRQGRHRPRGLGAVFQSRADPVAARRRRARGAASHRSLRVSRRRPQGDQRGAAVRARADREARAVARALARATGSSSRTRSSRRRRTSIPRRIWRGSGAILEDLAAERRPMKDILAKVRKVAERAFGKAEPRAARGAPGPVRLHGQYLPLADRGGRVSEVARGARARARRAGRLSRHARLSHRPSARRSRAARGCAARSRL